MGPSFLLYKMGRTIVPILEGSSEGEMREDGSRHMGGTQTMSPVGDVVITVVTWPPGCWASSPKALPAWTATGLPLSP